VAKQGHSNNTWHFIGTFLHPPPAARPLCDTLLFWMSVFNIYVFENVKWTSKKVYPTKPNLAFKQDFYFQKPLKTMFQEAEKICVT